MMLSGALGRLFAVQGLAGVVLAVLASGHERRAAAWILAFLGIVLISTGGLLWLYDAESAGDLMEKAEKRGRQRATEGRNDGEDQ